MFSNSFISDFWTLKSREWFSLLFTTWIVLAGLRSPEKLTLLFKYWVSPCLNSAPPCSFTITGCSDYWISSSVFTACFLLSDSFAYFAHYVPCLVHFKWGLTLQADVLNVCSLAGSTVLGGCRTFRQYGLAGEMVPWGQAFEGNTKPLVSGLYVLLPGPLWYEGTITHSSNPMNFPIIMDWGALKLWAKTNFPPESFSIRYLTIVILSYVNNVCI